MRSRFIRLFLVLSFIYMPQTVFAQSYIKDFAQFKAVACQTAAKYMILGNFGGWKISSNPREKFEQVNFLVCFPTMLQCRNWLKYLESIYTIRPPYQEVCLRDKL